MRYQKILFFFHAAFCGGSLDQYSWSMEHQRGISERVYFPTNYKEMAQDVEQLVYTVLISFQCFPLIPKSRKYMYLAVENLF